MWTPRTVFMRARPPYGPLTAAAIGDIAHRALRRAGVVTHRAGAHTFRHTALSLQGMLRQLDLIFPVCRDAFT